MADWEEIKRLAADFQRAQLSSTAQRLSDRNCVEIVQKLIELKLIDVIYTTDGKEYLTPVELGKEIREELLVHGGRVNLVELQQILNVDFRHVESKANEIVKSDTNLSLVLGQLVDESYLDNIAEEINDRLQEQGQITLAEITKTYDLPRDFISDAVKNRLGVRIQGKRDPSDPDIIYTEAFVNRQKSKIRGVFSAVTRPVSLNNMMQQYQLQERLFYSILEELIQEGRLAGSVSGGRQVKSEYMPDIYTRSQNEWVENFYKQNGYLEYDALTRLGISDPKNYIKKRFKEEHNLMYLSTCCVGRNIQDFLDAQIEEGLTSVGWIDVMPHLPSVFSTNDSNQIIQKILKNKPEASIFCDHIVASQDFVKKCLQSFEVIMQTKAEKDVKANPALLSKQAQKDGHQDQKMDTDKKEARRQKASAGKSGGGTQGRETKTKATKKKYMKGGKGNQADEDSDDGTQAASAASSGKQAEVEFLSPDEIEDKLKEYEAMQECPEDFVEEIAQKIYRPMKKQYQEIVKSVFLQSQGSSTTSARKKTHGDLSEKLTGLWTNAKLFEKAIKCFPEDSQPPLVKHLLRTVCTDITNIVFNAMAADHMLSVSDETTITPEVRTKMMTKLPEGKHKVVLNKLNNSLAAKTLEDFFTSVDSACGTGMIEVMLKKPDKKKERQLVFNHKISLAEQLKEETEPAMTLHLAVTLLFNVFTQCMVHAPGRCVPSIMTFLKPHMQPDSYQTLVTFQDLVMQQITHKSEDTDEAEKKRISDTLEDMLPRVKDIALNTRKANSAAVPTAED